MQPLNPCPQEQAGVPRHGDAAEAAGAVSRPRAPLRQHGTEGHGRRQLFHPLVAGRRGGDRAGAAAAATPDRHLRPPHA